MKTTTKITVIRTEYGFQFGAANVSCLCSDETKGWAIIGISSPKGELQIYTTRTGKIRVFKNNQELFTAVDVLTKANINESK